MAPFKFTSNDRPSLGVEVEVQLVDAETMALRPAFDEVLGRLPGRWHAQVKPEIMRSYLEINTGVCGTVADAGRDLAGVLRAVDEAAAGAGVRLAWGATHPFSRWQEQEVTTNDRYFGLVELLQDSARRLVTFGLHVHVGLDSGDKAIMVCERIMSHLPTLLALSANSPFWNGRATGLQSYRTKVMESLPTAGLPPVMRNWSEYVWLVNHLVSTGYIRSIREVWWDVRPHHNFGTVEVRICDLPPDLPSVLGLTALIQCLVVDLSDEIDRGAYVHAIHPMMVRQNKWRACRFGLSASLVDPLTFEPRQARQVVRDLVDRLAGVADRLGCADELRLARGLAEGPTGADRQLAAFGRSGDLADVVRQSIPPAGR